MRAVPTAVKATTSDGRRRCAWVANASPRMLAYHDEQWGVPVRDDRQLFAKLILDGAQAGLSWSTILAREEGYYRAFHDFDPARIARYGDKDVARLLADPGIIRNRAKVRSAIANARAYLKLQEEEGSFADWLWRFVDGEPVRNRWRDSKQVPAETPLSQAVSKSLRERGFTFVGPTIVYAFMQAVGMVNDHLVSCYRHAEVAAPANAKREKGPSKRRTSR
ncbi:MAG TPA: DNA-3-methyladenine glycosylase I [Thermoanaerobaculia bacterium]|jgi:DNA-3-methyladenine glycosylase I|nr:DNA-3-methyladenine glycosylase I [Thermoanaerobaculia bacterium]